jgi:hypothetical protein
VTTGGARNAAMVNIPSRTLSLQASGLGALGKPGKLGVPGASGKLGKLGMSGKLGKFGFSAPISAAPTLSESGPAMTRLDLGVC